MDCLGKLKKTLKQKCPDCGEKNLQLRCIQKKEILDGEIIITEVEYLSCPNCEYEELYEPKRKRRDSVDKYEGYQE